MKSIELRPQECMMQFDSLTFQQGGIYVTLMLKYAERDGMLTEADIKAMTSKLSEPVRNDYAIVLEQFFYREFGTGRWRHSDLDRQIEKKMAISVKRRAAANTRYASSHANASALAVANAGTSGGANAGALAGASGLANATVDAKAPAKELANAGASADANAGALAGANGTANATDHANARAKATANAGARGVANAGAIAGASGTANAELSTRENPSSNREKPNNDKGLQQIEQRENQGLPSRVRVYAGERARSDDDDLKDINHHRHHQEITTVSSLSTSDENSEISDRQKTLLRVLAESDFADVIEPVKRALPALCDKGLTVEMLKAVIARVPKVVSNKTNYLLTSLGNEVQSATQPKAGKQTSGIRQVTKLSRSPENLARLKKIAREQGIDVEGVTE